MQQSRKLGSRGCPPIPITAEDITILASLSKHEGQVQIAAKLKWNTSRVCRRIQKLQAHQLVVVDQKTGKRVPNPVYFPKLAGKTPPPVQTATGTLPGKKYSTHVHNTQCDCEVMPSSAQAYAKLRKTFKLLNHMDYWDRLLIEDKDLGYFGAKRFANPNFIVMSTTRKLFFHPWGWGNTDDEAEADAAKGAEELHDKLEKILGIKLGFKFQLTSKTGKRQPEYSLHANAPVSMVPPTQVPASVAAQSPAPVTPQLIVKGVAIRPDISHPDDLEGVGKIAGRTLTQIGKDLESIPQLVTNAVNTQLQQMVQDAVARGIAQAIAPLTTAIRDAVVAGIQQGLAQAPPAPGASQPPARPPNGTYT